MRKTPALLALVAFAMVFLLFANAALAQTNPIQINHTAIAATNRPVLIATNPPTAVATHSAPVPQLASAPTQAVQTVFSSVPTNPTSATATESRDNTKYAALLISLMALGYTVWKDYRTDKRVKKIEAEQERERKEAAVRRSKASAPYFSPSKKLVQMVYETSDDDGGMYAWHGDNVLSLDHREIPATAPDQTPVILLLDTGGRGARHISITGDIPSAELKQEPDIQDAHRLVYLKYPYNPSQRGKTQNVVLTFETEDGFELTHTYETRHGCFEFHRIDPK